MHYKKTILGFFSFLITALMFTFGVNAEIVAQGSYGIRPGHETEVTYRIERDGADVKLIISGHGEMMYRSHSIRDYRDAVQNLPMGNVRMPWDNYANIITVVIIESGITNVNKGTLHTFDICSNRQAVYYNGVKV